MSDSPEEDESDTVGAAVITISSNSSLEEDDAGKAIVAAFETAGHEIVTRELIQRDYDNVQSNVSRLVDRTDADIVITVGGTGIEPQDVTLEAVRPLLDKELPAFLDLFHSISYDELGTGVVSSRALGGISEGVPIFCLPNDSDAVRIACESIIVPEAQRLVTLASSDTDEE